jgi:hypothetical protein
MDLISKGMICIRSHADWEQKSGAEAAYVLMCMVALKKSSSETFFGEDSPMSFSRL